MQDAIAKASGKTYAEIAQGSQTTSAAAQLTMDQWLWEWGDQIESLFDDYPLLRDICRGLKKNQYPAAVFVAGGLMMTLMTRCTYRFYHRPEELRRLNNSTLIIGDLPVVRVLLLVCSSSLRLLWWQRTKPVLQPSTATRRR